MKRGTLKHQNGIQDGTPCLGILKRVILLLPIRPGRIFEVLGREMALCQVRMICVMFRCSYTPVLRLIPIIQGL